MACLFSLGLGAKIISNTEPVPGRLLVVNASIRGQVFVFMDVYAPALGSGVCVHGCVCTSIRAQVFVFMDVYAPALRPVVCVHGCLCTSIRVRCLCSWVCMH